jgi:hypothetical protein
MTPADMADPASFQSIADLPPTTGISLYVFLHATTGICLISWFRALSQRTNLIAYRLNLKKKK